MPDGSVLRDISRDGERFLILTPTGEDLPSTELHVVLRTVPASFIARIISFTSVPWTTRRQRPFAARKVVRQIPSSSPDGEWVGFYSTSDAQLEKVAIRGGAPVRLCDADGQRGAQWGADDTIVFGQANAGIMQVSADGGTPEILIPLEGTEEVGLGPQVLPGEKAVLFTLGDGRNWDDAQIVVHSLETGERKVLIEGGTDARYLPTGHIVYALGGESHGGAV